MSPTICAPCSTADAHLWHVVMQLLLLLLLQSSCTPGGQSVWDEVVCKCGTEVSVSTLSLPLFCPTVIQLAITMCADTTPFGHAGCATGLGGECARTLIAPVAVESGLLFAVLCCNAFVDSEWAVTVICLYLAPSSTTAAGPAHGRAASPVWREGPCDLVQRLIPEG